MNERIHVGKCPRARQLAAAVLIVVMAMSATHAQPTEQTVQSRFLFVFDTSKGMKPRLEATKLSLNTMLATSLRGQLHSGDSLGVWTFAETLQTKGYPLQTWNPDAAVVISSNMVRHVENQRYGKSTRFEALQPLLNRVMQDSERLTVLIYCDGESQFSGTPYDDAINRALKVKFPEQKKAEQPLVIVLRSQLGQYVGCTVSLPPQLVNLPQFPPLPVPPPPAPAPVTNTPPAPVAIAQPLIIIGKKPAASGAPPASNPPPAATVEIPATNAPEMMPATPTNAVVLTTNAASSADWAMAITNQPVIPSDNSGSGHKVFLVIGAGLAGAVIALGLVFALRPRRSESSLITRSMNDPK